MQAGQASSITADEKEIIQGIIDTWLGTNDKGQRFDILENAMEIYPNLKKEIQDTIFLQFAGTELAAEFRNFLKIDEQKQSSSAASTPASAAPKVTPQGEQKSIPRGEPGDDKGRQPKTEQKDPHQENDPNFVEATNLWRAFFIFRARKFEHKDTDIHRQEFYRAFLNYCRKVFELGLPTESSTNKTNFLNLIEIHLLPVVAMEENPSKHFRENFLLALLYEVGIGVEKDLFEARKYLEKSSNVNFPPAQHFLAFMHDQLEIKDTAQPSHFSRTVTLSNDGVKTRNRLLEAAAKPYSPAKFERAQLQTKNLQLPLDERDLAKKEIMNLAKAGDPFAQYLAGYYLEASGHPDYVEWYRLSANQRYHQAEEKLAARRQLSAIKSDLESYSALSSQPQADAKQTDEEIINQALNAAYDAIFEHQDRKGFNVILNAIVKYPALKTKLSEAFRGLLPHLYPEFQKFLGAQEEKQSSVSSAAPASSSPSLIPNAPPAEGSAKPKFDEIKKSFAPGDAKTPVSDSAPDPTPPPAPRSAQSHDEKEVKAPQGRRTDQPETKEALNLIMEKYKLQPKTKMREQRFRSALELNLKNAAANDFEFWFKQLQEKLGTAPWFEQLYVSTFMSFMREQKICQQEKLDQRIATLNLPKFTDSETTAAQNGELHIQFEWYQKLKSRNDLIGWRALIGIGESQQHGWGTIKDLEAAKNSYTQASKNFPPALAYLGIIEEEVNEDSKKARMNYRESKSDFGLYRLARNYIEVDKVREKDEILNKTAYDLLLELGSRGSKNAHFILALCYKNANGIPEDLSSAKEHFLKAAELGHTETQSFVAEAFRRGRNGFPKNLNEALRWYHKAAIEEDSSQVQFKLGQAYETGTLGLEQNKAYAVIFYRMAADKGHQEAQLHLALLLSVQDGPFVSPFSSSALAEAAASMAAVTPSPPPTITEPPPASPSSPVAGEPSGSGLSASQVQLSEEPTSAEPVVRGMAPT